MKNETIKTYTEITPLDGLKLTVASEGEAIEGLMFCDIGGFCNNDTLQYVAPSAPLPFVGARQSWAKCATVTELNPCQSPDGCPELEPWMAYVGDDWANKEVGRNEPSIHWIFDGRWESSSEGHCGLGQNRPYAIDVREEWSLREFPEHCRIRAYVEPKPLDALDIWWRDSGGPKTGKSKFRDAYELGQANSEDTARLEWVMQQLKGKSFTFAPGPGCLGKLDRSTIDWAMKGATS